MSFGFKINLLPREYHLQSDKDRLLLAYELLKVTPGDSPAKIEKRYRKLVKPLNPDKLSRDPAAQARAIEELEIIDEAYSLIKNDILRRKNRYWSYYQGRVKKH